MKSSILAKLRKARGFTLIELLIVIAIIAILTVAFLPTLRGGQSGARNAARKSAVNDLVIAIERIANGDIPAGACALGAASCTTLPGGTTVGAIPVSGGACLDFANGLGADIRAVLGNTPASQGTNTNLCYGANESGYYYRAFKADGSAAGGVGDIVTNYVIITELELPKTSGNVSGADINLGAPPNPATAKAAVALEFDTRTKTLNRTTGVGTNPLWAVSK